VSEEEGGERGKVVQSSHGGKCMRFSCPEDEAGVRQMNCTEYGRHQRNGHAIMCC